MWSEHGRTLAAFMADAVVGDPAQSVSVQLLGQVLADCMAVRAIDERVRRLLVAQIVNVPNEVDEVHPHVGFHTRLSATLGGALLAARRAGGAQSGGGYAGFCVQPVRNFWA